MALGIVLPLDPLDSCCTPADEVRAHGHQFTDRETPVSSLPPVIQCLSTQMCYRMVYELRMLQFI